jgi:hypothetical protein
VPPGESDQPATAVAIHQAFLEQFIASFDTAPAELILDFAATDHRAHSPQEGRFFHPYYDTYCFPPLDVFFHLKFGSLDVHVRRRREC